MPGNDSYTKLLVQSNTMDGSTTFADISASAHTVTPYGGVHHETDWHSLGSSSIAFDGDGDFLWVTDSGGLNFGTSDFTIDVSVYIHAFASGYAWFLDRNIDRGSTGWVLFATASYIKFEHKSPSINLNYSYSVPLDTKIHIAVVKSGSTWTLYLDGVQRAQLTNATAITAPATTDVCIGNLYSSSQYFNGYQEDIRISHTARWTANFTPPTTLYDNLEAGTFVGAGGAVAGGSANVESSAPIIFEATGGAIGGGIAGVESYNLYPTHHWTFDNVTGDNAYDEVSPGVNIICEDWTQIAGKFQYGVRQTNTLYPKRLVSNVLFESVSIWFKRISTSMFTTVLSCEDWSQCMIHVNPNYGGGIFVKSFGGAYSDSGLFVTDTAWHHLVLTKITDTSAYLYLDGVKSVAFPWLFSEGVDYFSASMYMSSSDENADIDNIQVYDRPLTEDEVDFLFSAQSQIETLPLYYAFESVGGGVGGGVADVTLSGTIEVTGHGGAVVGGAADVLKNFVSVLGYCPEYTVDSTLETTTVVNVLGYCPEYYGDIQTGWDVLGYCPEYYGDASLQHTVQVAVEGNCPEYAGSSDLLVTQMVDVLGFCPEYTGEASVDVDTTCSVLGYCPEYFGDAIIEMTRFVAVLGYCPEYFGSSIIDVGDAADEILSFDPHTFNFIQEENEGDCPPYICDIQVDSGPADTVLAYVRGH